jgi:SAM-dependent methyltransferase
MSPASTQISESAANAAPCPARLKRLLNRHGKIWLNVGGGNYFLDDFVNVDSNFLFFIAPFYPAIRPLLKKQAREWLEGYKARRQPNNFVFANCRLPLKFPKNSVDHILISHFLEHLHYDDAVAVLKNYYSILMPGGTLHIIVPDLAQKARDYVGKIGDASSTEAFVDWMNFRKRHMVRLPVRILQVTGWFDLLHCFLYDLSSLSKLVQDIGFGIVPQERSPSAYWRLNDPCQVNILAQKPAE